MNTGVLLKNAFTSKFITEDDCRTLNIGPFGQRRLILGLAEDEDESSTTNELTKNLGQLFKSAAQNASLPTPQDAISRYTQAQGESPASIY